MRIRPPGARSSAPDPPTSIVTERRVLRTGDIDLRATMKPIGVYPRDPTTRWTTNSFAKAVLTPEGPGTMSLAWDGNGSTTVEAWGSGADWLVERAPHWVGLHDDLDGFDPSLHPKIAEWSRRHCGIRLPAAGVIWQELLLVLLGQRVTSEEAVKSWARLAYAWGEPAPGPCESAPAADTRGGRVEDLRRTSSLQRRTTPGRRDPARQRVERTGSRKPQR